MDQQHQGGTVQLSLLGEDTAYSVRPFRLQLLKWVGNKQRYANEIVSVFPSAFRRYREPFLGSGAVLGTLAPKSAVASDAFPSLMEIWQTLSESPDQLKEWYAERWQLLVSGDKVGAYERVKASYNAHPNGADLLFLCRSCYGGVVRFRQADGYMSTPCGAHTPIRPEAFSVRVDEWHRRTSGTKFELKGYEEAMAEAEPGDLIYCDPPYVHSQTILYGAQTFSFRRLMEVVDDCKQRGVYVALSIDGSKRSGRVECALPIPSGLFERESYVNTGRSMLKRFQMNGKTLHDEVVADRLLLTY